MKTWSRVRVEVMPGYGFTCSVLRVSVQSFEGTREFEVPLDPHFEESQFDVVFEAARRELLRALKKANERPNEIPRS